ncbi:sterile alpha motif domain-containing protein 1-like [Monodelphis domestica]|uniref:sterile alpha motif domain-containing protein 1-like n=1 Tax=Monodelphis domestica TaxID=13616 RepID=UPI0024E1D51B|nr:sterile alpha motif domain-containing protein 1-like [Monodelphis domestica]
MPVYNVEQAYCLINSICKISWHDFVKRITGSFSDYIARKADHQRGRATPSFAPERSDSAPLPQGPRQARATPPRGLGQHGALPFARGSRARSPPPCPAAPAIAPSGGGTRGCPDYDVQAPSAAGPGWTWSRGGPTPASAPKGRSHNGEAGTRARQLHGLGSGGLRRTPERSAPTDLSTEEDEDPRRAGGREQAKDPREKERGSCRAPGPGTRAAAHTKRGGGSACSQVSPAARAEPAPCSAPPPLSSRWREPPDGIFLCSFSKAPRKLVLLFHYL